VSTDKEDFRLLSGQSKVYVKTAESGAKRAQGFCPQCGSRIYAAAEIDPQTFNLRVGTIRQRRELRPITQSWCRSALDWVMDLGSVPRNAQGRPKWQLLMCGVHIQNQQKKADPHGKIRCAVRLPGNFS